MTESELKRSLVRSVRAQGGTGNRFEDKYSAGFPDLLLIPAHGPVFFTEVKLIRAGAKLVCTPLQEAQLERLHRPRREGVWYSHGLVVGFHLKLGRLYAGQPETPLNLCPSIERPKRLDSADWKISELLQDYDRDRGE